MIKLKDLLKLDKMKYAKSIKPRHQRRIDLPSKHINEVQVKHMPPPDNSSRTTRQELEWLKNYNDGNRGGRVKVRAKVEKYEKNIIIIKEIPYGTTLANFNWNKCWF